MRWLFDIYIPFAKKGQRELRSPGSRLLVSLFCLGCAGWLIWLAVRTYLGAPTQDWKGLLILSVPLWGAMYLFYVIYIALFAPGHRVRRGLISVPWLRVLGYLCVPLGFYMLSQGRLDGAIAIVAGLGCLGLAQERKEWTFRD